MAYVPWYRLAGEDRRTYEQIKSIVSTMASTCGIISTETDLNKYMFDLTNLYRNYYSAQNKKPGLCKIKLYFTYVFKYFF